MFPIAESVFRLESAFRFKVCLGYNTVLVLVMLALNALSVNILTGTSGTCLPLTSINNSLNKSFLFGRFKNLFRLIHQRIVQISDMSNIQKTALLGPKPDTFHKVGQRSDFYRLFKRCCIGRQHVASLL